MRRKLEEALEASVAGGQQRSKNSACANGEKRGEFRGYFRDLSTHAESALMEGGRGGTELNHGMDCKRLSCKRLIVRRSEAHGTRYAVLPSAGPAWPRVDFQK